MGRARGLYGSSVFFVVAAVAAAGCVAGCAAGSPTGVERQGIIGGTNDTMDPAVVLVLAQNNQSEALCSGEVVSPHVILTAAHCVDPVTVGSGMTFSVFLGADYNDAQQANDPSLMVDVQETHYDKKFNPSQLPSGHDVGVVILSSPVSITPLPMNRVALTQSDVGSTLRLVGYGIDDGNDEQGTSAGTKRQTSTTISQVSQHLVSFDDGSHNTCEGDSGGPAFLVRNGVEVIAGITSFGDQSCEKGGSDTRVDLYASVFVDPYIAMFDPPPVVAQPDMEMPPSVVPSVDMSEPATVDAPDMAQGSTGTSQPTQPVTTSGGTEAVGAVCHEHSDCASDICVFSGDTTGYCTAVCDPNEAKACPSGMTCGVIATGHYCVRGTTATQGGCSMGGRAPSLPGSWPLSLCMLLAPLGLALRGARNRKKQMA